MTHKQKALDLIHSFYYALPNNGSTQGINSTTTRYQEAIQCALIAVNEIVEELDKDSINYQIALDYWNEVKLEIQNRNDSKTTN